MPAHSTSAILRRAAETIEDPERFSMHYTAATTPERNRGVVACLPSADVAERWSAMGAIWRELRNSKMADVRQAHHYFASTVAGGRALGSWCLATNQEQQVEALRAAANRLAEAA